MTDIFGNMPKVGDKVAYAEPSTATIAYMKVGTVVEVTKDSIVINREYIGYDAYERNCNELEYKLNKDVLKPRKHCKFVIISKSIN